MIHTGFLCFFTVQRGFTSRGNVRLTPPPSAGGSYSLRSGGLLEKGTRVRKEPYTLVPTVKVLSGSGEVFQTLMEKNLLYQEFESVD